MVGCGKKNEDLESKYLTFTTTKKCTFCVYHKESGLITHPIPNLQYSINGGN
ncbi:MAG: hypothetical protein MJ219_00610 [Mycoplasmoidaceae bacterium]|nr:hypothetical protein [Mycoplasmoidaceae bacterium]